MFTTNRTGSGVRARIATRSSAAEAALWKVSTTATPSSPITKPAFEPAPLPGIATAAQTPRPTSCSVMVEGAAATSSPEARLVAGAKMASRSGSRTE